METNYQKQANKSFKWTTLAEVSAKLIPPLMNMVLSRIILPEIFGIVASISIIVSFADMVAESGFSKYLVQHKFSNEKELKVASSTAFFSMTVISAFLFSMILIFRFPLANAVNSTGYEYALALSAIQIPIFGMNSINIGLLRRGFKFKPLALIRISGVIVQAIVSITLACLGLPIYALIFGPIANASMQLVLTFIARKASFSWIFSFSSLKNMISESSLFLLETLFVWLATSIDIFFIGKFFSPTETGWYKNAISTTNGIISLVTAIFTPVLFSYLSKIESDEEFNKMVLKYQKLIAYFVVPMGFGLLIYRDFFTLLFFGKGWEGASIIIGVYGLIASVSVPLNNISSIIYLSKGKPIRSIVAQAFYLASIIITCLLFSKFGFNWFVIIRSMCFLVLIVATLIILKITTTVSVSKMLSNMFMPFLFSLIMSAVCVVLTLMVGVDVRSSIAGILIGFLTYAFLVVFFKKDVFKSIVETFIKPN